MTPTPPPAALLLGPLLTQLRLARGWSQQRIAAELCAASGVPTLSRHEVSRWERQARVPGDFWLHWLAIVLAAPVELLAAAAARTRRLTAPPAGPGPGARSRAALLALAQRWLADPQAALLVAAPGRLSAPDVPPAPPGPYPRSGPRPRPDTPGTGPHPGPRPRSVPAARPVPSSGTPPRSGPAAPHHPDPAAPRSAPAAPHQLRPAVPHDPGPAAPRELDLTGLRRLDDLAGGLDLAPLGAERLRRAVRALPRSGPAGRHRLLPVLAESAQLAGWLATDAGDLAGALDAYRLGLRAAAAAGDPALAGHVLGSASHLLAGAGDPHGALLLARTAYAGSRRWASPGLRALLLHRVALAAALGGRPDAARQALGGAERAGEVPDPEREPPWLYWLDGPELAAMTGRTLVALGRPRHAEALLGTARDPGRPRRAAIYGGWLALGYLQLGELELACDVADTALLDAVRAGSPRAVTQLTEVRHRLAAHRRAPAVRRHAALVAAARPYLPRPASGTIGPLSRATSAPTGTARRRSGPGALRGPPGGWRRRIPAGTKGATRPASVLA